jgi:hypothetical protein
LFLYSSITQIIPNTTGRFDDYRYFITFGKVDDLNVSIDDMELEVALCVDQVRPEKKSCAQTFT